MLFALLCPALCNPMDSSPPGSPVQEILRARIWSGLPFPSPGDPPHPGIEPRSPESSASQVDSLLLSHQGSPVSLADTHKPSEEGSLPSLPTGLSSWSFGPWQRGCGNGNGVAANISLMGSCPSLCFLPSTFLFEKF